MGGRGQRERKRHRGKDPEKRKEWGKMEEWGGGWRENFNY